MGFDITTSRAANPRAILAAVEAQLVNDLGDIFTSDTIAVAGDDAPPETMLDKLFIILSGMDSEFPDDVQTGGAQYTCEELWALKVTVYSSERLDQTGRWPAAVYDPDEGLLEIKRRVLKSLVGADPTSNQLPMLSAIMAIRSASWPRRDDKGVYFMELVFNVPFFYDLDTK